MSLQAGNLSTAPRTVPSSSLERAVLLTVLYADLFDYPLTEDEIHRDLVGLGCELAEVCGTLERLLDSHLEKVGRYFVWRGRAAIAETRQRRETSSRQRWKEAELYAGWLWRAPFVRLIAVCGSQATENGEADADVDIFCIAEAERLWIVQLQAMVLAKLVSLRGVHICPNYFLARSHLEVPRQSLYTAHEITQAVPLRGPDSWEEFRQANRWTDGLLPNRDAAEGEVGSNRRFLRSTGKPPVTRLAERLLRGRLGNVLDRLVHRLMLLYYPLRLRKRGWGRELIRRTYSRHRQEIMTGGYGPAVEREFVARARQQLGDSLPDQELDRLFPGRREGEAVPDPLYAGQFADRYGAGGSP